LRRRRQKPLWLQTITLKASKTASFTGREGYVSTKISSLHSDDELFRPLLNSSYIRPFLAITKAVWHRMASARNKEVISNVSEGAALNAA